MGFELDTSGLDNFAKELKEKANELEGDVSFAMLFDSSFMLKYTTFVNLEDLFEQGGYEINSPENYRAILGTSFDDYISNRTRFNSWDEMLTKAGEEYTVKKLGF